MKEWMSIYYMECCVKPGTPCHYDLKVRCVEIKMIYYEKWIIIFVTMLELACNRIIQ